MHNAVRVAALLSLVSAASWAASWSGMLVNSKCYQNEESNHNPTDTLTSVDTDKDQEIRVCSPTARTKTFAIVDRDGLSFRLDRAGNAKASALVPKWGKRSLIAVTVTGEKNRNTIQVESISKMK